MTGRTTCYQGAAIFDGEVLREGHALAVRGGAVAGLMPVAEVRADAERVDLDGGILAPGYVDLQVNGGGGVMFNDAPSVVTLETIAQAHTQLGATSILPTLITDTPEVTRAAIAAATDAIADGVPGIAGLHLEGPHLSLARKGAHDPALIRPMTDADLEILSQAARALPVLLLTVAPEMVTPDQIGALVRAGAVVSLGHSDAGYDTCRHAVAAGATCATHLFNAMSQLAGREPGLVGAALASPELSAGLIADLIHVHPESIAAALRAKRGPGQVFLVSDAMATAGWAGDAFELNGRRIERHDGRLTLQDGTLAGADLDLTSAVRNIETLGVPLPQALAMATSVPAALIGAAARLGHLAAGCAADFVHLTEARQLAGVWRHGVRVLPDRPVGNQR